MAWHPPPPMGRIRPPFPFVSYEATKRVSWWQCIYDMGLMPTPCVTFTEMSIQNDDTIPNTLSNPFTHSATCCWLVCAIPLLHPSNSSHSLYTFPLTGTGVRGNHHVDNLLLIITWQYFITELHIGFKILSKERVSTLFVRIFSHKYKT